METVNKIVRDLFSQVGDGQFDVGFVQLGIDSFDLLELRVRLENSFGHRIPDTRWVGFKSFQDIERYYGESQPKTGPDGSTTGITHQRALRLNMPQMVLGGLSEHWLFKELGDIHWEMVCDALETQSHNVLDELGNRLYATFVRVRWESSSHHLKQFRENEELEFNGDVFRFGKSMFFSNVAVAGEGKNIKASLMSTFSVRQSDNKSLLKGEPTIPTNSRVKETVAMPPLGEEYRETRRGNQHSVVLDGDEISLGKENLFEIEYELNPYHDVNGVNLLYFAAYPTINDVCEARFIHLTRQDLLQKFWAAEASTVARDVFYYGNCNLDDKIVFRVNSCEVSPDNKIKLATSLLRKSDGQQIANVFTVKQIHGPVIS